MNPNKYSDINNELIDFDSFNECRPVVNQENIYDDPIQTLKEFKDNHENNIEKLLSITPKAYKTCVFIDNSEDDVNACLHADNSSIRECDRNEIYQQDEKYIKYTLSQSTDLKLGTSLHTTSADESSETVLGKRPIADIRHRKSLNTELKAEIINFQGDKVCLNYQSSEIHDESDMSRNSCLGGVTAYNAFDTNIKFEDEMLIRTNEAHYLKHLQNSTNVNQDTQSTEDTFTKLLLIEKQMSSCKVISDLLANKLNEPHEIYINSNNHPRKGTFNVKSYADADSRTCHKTSEYQQNFNIGKNEYAESFDTIKSQLTSKKVEVDYGKLKDVLEKTNTLITNDTCDGELSNMTVSQRNVIIAEKTQFSESTSKNKYSQICKFICEHCDRHFKSKNSLKSHIIAKELNSNSAGQFQCELCKKTFFKYRRLYDHVVNLHEHSENQCGICEKKFKCRKYMRQHIMRIHVKKNISNANNNEAFEYNCEFCSKRFKAKDNLNHHVNNNHKSGPCICHICGSVLKCQPYLLNHMRRVHYDDGKSHKCECGKTFRSPRYLDIHKKNMKHFNKPITVKRPLRKYINESLIPNSYTKTCIFTNDSQSDPKIDETNNNGKTNNSNFTDEVFRKFNQKSRLREYAKENGIPVQPKPSIAPKDDENGKNLVTSDKNLSTVETYPKFSIYSISTNYSNCEVFITNGHEDQPNTTEKAGKRNDNVSEDKNEFVSAITSIGCSNKVSASTSKENIYEWSINFENSVKKTHKILRRLKKSAKKPSNDTSVDWCIETGKMFV